MSFSKTIQPVATPLSFHIHTFENFDNPVYYLGVIGLRIIDIFMVLLGFFFTVLGIIGIFGTLPGFFYTGYLFYAYCRNKFNDRSLIKVIEKGTRPKVEILDDKLFSRPIIVDYLKNILQPDSDQSFYYVVCGEHGSGKTTLFRIASSEVGRGVVYVDVPSRVEDFGKGFGKALNFAFEERISFTQQLTRKLVDTNGNSNEPVWWRALKAFKRGAKEYKAKYNKPAVIVCDNVSRLVHKNPEVLDILQDDAKDNADEHIYIAVFICSEGAVLRMKSRSSWSRAKNPPMEICDLSEEESIKYMTEIHKITEKAGELYQLVGGRILELKSVANDLSSKQFIEDIREKILLKAYNKLYSAKILKNQKHHEAGKRVIDALLRSKEINIEEFRELFANEEKYDDALEANVFSFHPSRNTVSFQSQSIEYYIRENYDAFADLVSLSSNYASTSK
ncbi:10154_t:CDS:2 [Acaulospora morrowiae]|uniref:10154_t:CDS:1 n=1 Tax=Acaulospora morrowiae TaxID=94023 RepID=A0A9N9DP21_9GLOM|nr:10154_t:CDS:2 [Acaulospora morrowiae]